MRRLALSVLVVAVGMAACAKEKSGPAESDLGTATANISVDTAIVKDAQAAVNEVVRNGSDCDAAKQAIPEANRKIAEAAGKIRTQAGRTIVDTLRNQVSVIERNCP